MTDLASELLGVIGENDEQATVENWCSTGYPPLNDAISSFYDGGMPGGRIVELFGPESSGKTAIATEVMIAAQQAGGIAMFQDHENSFDHHLGEGAGLDTSPGRWIYKRPSTFELSVDQAILVAQTVRGKKLIAPEAPLVVVFDSLASMLPKTKLFDAKELKKKEENRGARTLESLTMHDSLALAKACSAAFPVLSHHASKLNILMLFLNQEREKPGVMFGDPITTPGGRAPKFYASVRIQLGKSMIKKDGEVLGQTVRARVVKNKVSAPFKTAEWDFMFREDGTGFFDTIGGTLKYLKEKGLIETSGNYYVWKGRKYYLSQLTPHIIANNERDELFALLA